MPQYINLVFYIVFVTWIITRTRMILTIVLHLILIKYIRARVASLGQF